MSLKASISDAIKAAMRARETDRLGTLRMLSAAIKQVEVDQSQSLDDDDKAVVAIIRKMIKQRKDSIEQFQKGGRTDLAEAEAREIEWLSPFLPEDLSEADIQSIIDDVIKETGASSPKDMPNVRPLVAEKIAGRADMSTVSGMIKNSLSAKS